jgi:hypothetical protein
MLFLKRAVTALLLLLGVLFVYEGFGFEFRILNFPFLSAYGIPVGIGVIVLAVLLARYWRVPD